MAGQADKKLLRAVLEPRKPGALRQIAEACEAGADPNAAVPECSTPTGHVPAGRTLLTHAVHESSSNAVKRLLECGADPNIVDENGWTPWMASTLADESKRHRIQAALTDYGAETRGAHIGQLARAIADGDVEETEKLMESDQDLEILATFRVDLVGHQVGTDNASMLEFLLQHGMRSTSTNLINAIRTSKPQALDVLLEQGQAPESPDDNETPLMTAAALGDTAMVQRLVEAGADVNRIVDDNIEWTASFFARQAGHNDVADWLSARMSTSLLEEQAAITAGRDPKYRRLYEQTTAGETASTDEIVEMLAKWDERYGIAVSDVQPASIGVTFAELPADLDDLLAEVFEICPDASEYGDDLRKELSKNQQLALWWD